MSIGPLTMPISGTSLLSGPDSHQTMTLTTGVKPTTTETIKAGGHTYAKRGDLWYEQPAPSNGDLGAVLMTLSSLTDTGPVTKDGRSLHRLAPPAGTTIPLSAFGGLPAGATDATVAFEFYAEDDGTPAIISVDASWTQKVGKADQPASMHLEMIMARVGQPVNIEPPSPVWVTVRSKRLAYTMAHPSDWDVELAKKGSSNDWFYGPEGERLGVVRVVDCRCTLNTFTAELIRYERKHTKGFKLASNTAARVGGLRARRLESRGTYTDGRSWDLTYVVLRGRYLYVLDYGSDSPLTAQDRTIAAQLLGTVAFR